MTPEDLVASAVRVLTEKQREYYFENGYVTVEGAISDEWLERLRAVSNEMIEKSRTLTQSNDVFTLEDGHSSENPRLRRLTNPVTHHPVHPGSSPPSRRRPTRRPTSSSDRTSSSTTRSSTSSGPRAGKTSSGIRTSRRGRTRTTVRPRSDSTWKTAR